MTEKIQRLLSDSKAARWTALFLVSFTMFAGYYLADVLAPLKGLLENQLMWNSSEYGFVTSAYGWFNVFLFFLIIGGIILDKKGIRITGMGAAIIMVAGTGLKYWAISTHSLDGMVLFGWKAQVMYAALGYAIFGVGVEICGITASKVIVKWFKGKEMALAMGMQLSVARLGTALALSTSLPIALASGNVSTPILICLIMLCIGILVFFVYSTMDKKLYNTAIIVKGQAEKLSDPEEEFRIKDILKIVTNKGWWYIAILCVLFYSAVFPFLKYATELMIQKFHITESWAGTIPSLLPFGTILLTPFFGNLYDRKGKGATIMIVGALIIIFVHTLFSIPFLNHWLIAIALTIILGIGFSLVPSAMWPSVPKIIPMNQLGTAYSLIFWVQNWGLMGVPLLIGWVVDKYCFIGYFSLIGTGFITSQGDQINKVVTQDNKVYELTEAGIIGRIDTTYKVALLTPGQIGSGQLIITTAGDTIDSGFISEDAFKTVQEKREVEVPKYTYGDKEIISYFIDTKGQKVSKYYNITSFYNYTLPMIIFMGFGLLALLFAFLLKAEDRKKKYGLELPNIKK